MSPGRPYTAPRDTIGFRLWSVICPRHVTASQTFGDHARPTRVQTGQSGSIKTWGRVPWGVVTFEKMTKPEAVSTLVLTNTPQ